ncbi:MAG: hypothetical protein WBB82_09605 [Limnothrix sp.]
MNKNYLLYIGVFLAGAVITPLYLSAFNNDNEGDRPDADTAIVDTELDLTASPENFDTATGSNQVFVPNDSQEVVLNDYPVTQPPQGPSALPQYAHNQPSVRPYPNYSAFGSPALNFPATPQPKASTTKTPATKPQADKKPADSNLGSPQTDKTVGRSPLSSTLFDATNALPSNVFTPPKTAPDPNAVSPKPFDPSFGTTRQPTTSGDFNLEAFSGSTAIPVPDEESTQTEAE